MGGAGDLLEEGEFGGVEVEEAGAQVGGALVLSGPAGGGFVEFGGPDVDTGELSFAERIGEEVGEESCFVGASAGEVENVALGWDLGRKVGKGVNF